MRLSLTRPLALGCVLAVAACNPRSPNAGVSPSPSPTANAQTSMPAISVKGRGTKRRPVRFIESKGNREQFEIVTSSFESSGRPGATVLVYNNAHVTFIDKNGSRLFANAPKVTLDQRANTVVMTGGVRASNSAGIKLTCDTLIYNRTTEMVHGDGNVHIMNPNGFTGTGSHFDSDISLTHTRMT